MPPQAALGDDSSNSLTYRKADMEQQKDVPQKKEKRKRCVKFNRECEVRLIPALSEYSEIERYRVWHEPEEYQTIRSDCLDVVEKMRRGIPENEDLCYRGLEWKNPGAAKKKKLVRRRAQDVVFKEQERLWDLQEECPERIAQAYAVFSAFCHEDVFRRALQDAEAAEAVYNADSPNTKKARKFVVSTTTRPALSGSSRKSSILQRSNYLIPSDRSP